MAEQSSSQNEASPPYFYSHELASIAARRPSDGKLKIIEAAPGSYAKTPSEE